MNEIEQLIERLKEPDYKYYGCELSGSEAKLAISALTEKIEWWVDSMCRDCQSLEASHTEINQRVEVITCQRNGELKPEMTIKNL